MKRYFRKLITARRSLWLVGMINWIRSKTAAHAPWKVWVSLAALLAYGIFIGLNHAPVAAGADSGGYLGSARLLSEGKLTTQLRPVPEFNAVNSWAHTPLGYQLIPGEKILRPTYPIGLPLHYAAAGLFAGWYWGPLVVAVLAALAAVVGCYFCLRSFEVGPELAFAGAAAMAVSPLFLFSAFTPMSDVLATAWCSATILAALHSRKNRSTGWATACGVAFSVAVLVRPSNIILLPVIVLMLWNWRGLFLAGLGSLPGAVANGFYNQYMWGSAFRSGYGAVAGAFSKDYFMPTLSNFGETMPGSLPLIFVGIVCLPFLPWRTRTRELIASVVWAVVFIVFYSFYEFTNTAWWFLRFILPAFPALIVLSVAGMDRLIKKRSPQGGQSTGIIVAMLVVAVSLFASVRMSAEKHFMLMKEYQQPYVRVCDWAKQNMPPGSLVACMQTSSAFFYYTDFPILRWDATDPQPYADLKVALRQSGRAFYAVLLPFEVEDALKKRLPGHWEKITEFQSFSIWKYDATL